MNALPQVAFSKEELERLLLNSQMSQDKECMTFMMKDEKSDRMISHQVNFRRDANQKADAHGNTWLHIAALTGCEQMLLGFLQQGKSIDLEVRNGAGDTPLMVAARAGQLGICEMLLENKADLFAINRQEGYQAFHLAVESGSIPLVDLFLKKGARVNDPKSSKTNWSALHIAAEKGNTPMAAFLLEKGALITKARWDTKYSSVEGVPPLVLAAEKGDEELIRLLVKAGDDPHLVLDNGYNVLHWSYKNPPVFMLLLKEFQVNPIQFGERGIAPFHLIEDIELMKCLLEHSPQVCANIDSPFPGGETLLFQKCRLFFNSDVEWIILLLNHGANAQQEVKGEKVFAVLFHYVRYGNPPCIKIEQLLEVTNLFIAKGAKANYELRSNFKECSYEFRNNRELSRLIDANYDPGSCVLL